MLDLDVDEKQAELLPPSLSKPGAWSVSDENPQKVDSLEPEGD